MMTPEEVQALETEKRKIRVCFTGHRPEKLRQSEAEICRQLEREIRLAIADGCRVFLTGMARGVDLWAAELVLRLKQEYPHLLLVCVCAFEGEERKWNRDWQLRYNRVLLAANHRVCLSLGYERGCFLRRDRWMVDHVGRVIAVYQGSPGGTKYTVDYAMKTGVEVRFCGMEEKEDLR